MLTALLLPLGSVHGQVSLNAEWLSWQPNGIGSQWNLVITNNEGSYQQVYLLMKVAEPNPARSWQATTESFPLPVGQRFFRPGDVSYARTTGIPENLHGPVAITFSLYVQGENRLLATAEVQGMAGESDPGEASPAGTSKDPWFSLGGSLQTALQYVEDSVRGGGSDFVRVTAAPRLEVQGIPLSAQVAYTADGTGAWKSANAFSVSFSSRELVEGVKQRLATLADSMVPQEVPLLKAPDSLTGLKDPEALKSVMDTSAYFADLQQRLKDDPKALAGDSLYQALLGQSQQLKAYESFATSGHVQTVMSEVRTKLGNPKDLAEAESARDSLCQRAPDQCAYYHKLCANYGQIQAQVNTYETLKKGMKGIRMPEDPQALRQQAQSDSLYQLWQAGKGAWEQTRQLAGEVRAHFPRKKTDTDSTAVVSDSIDNQPITQQDSTTETHPKGDSLFQAWRGRVETLKTYASYTSSASVQQVLEEAKTNLGNPRTVPEAEAARDSLCAVSPGQCAYYRKLCASYVQVKSYQDQYESLQLLEKLTGKLAALQRLMPAPAAPVVKAAQEKVSGLTPEQIREMKANGIAIPKDEAAWKAWVQEQGADSSASAWLGGMRRDLETNPDIQEGDSLYEAWKGKAGEVETYKQYASSGYVQSVLNDARTKLGNPRTPEEAEAARDSLCRKDPGHCAYYRRLYTSYVQVEKQMHRFDSLKQHLDGMELPKDPQTLRKKVLSDSLYQAWRNGRGALKQVNKLAGKLASIQQLNIGVFMPVTASPCVDFVQVKGLELAVLTRKNVYFATVTGQSVTPATVSRNDSLNTPQPSPWWLTANTFGLGAETGTHIRGFVMAALPNSFSPSDIPVDRMNTILGASGQWVSKSKSTLLKTAVYQSSMPDSFIAGVQVKGVAVQALARYQSPAGKPVRQQVTLQGLYVTPEFHSVAAPLMLTNRVQARLTHTLSLSKGKITMTTSLRRDALVKSRPDVHADQIGGSWTAAFAFPRLPRVQVGYVPTLKTPRDPSSFAEIFRGGQWIHLVNTTVTHSYAVGKARADVMVAYSQQFAPNIRMEPGLDSLPVQFRQITARHSLAVKQVQVSLGGTWLDAGNLRGDQASTDLTVTYTLLNGLRLTGGGGVQRYDDGQLRWFGMGGCTWQHKRLSLNTNLTYYQRTRPGFPGTMARVAVGYRM